MILFLFFFVFGYTIRRMEKRRATWIFVWLSILSAAKVMPAVPEFAVPAQDIILQPKHIYNFSGSITVRPDVQQFGFCEMFSPPFTANPLRAIWKLNNQPIPVSDYLWQPSGTFLKGTLKNNLSVSLHIVPLSKERALVCKLILTNNGQSPFKGTLSFEITGKVGRTEDWGWVPPSAGGSDTAVTIMDKAMVLTSKDAQLAILFDPSPIRFDEQKAACFEIDLPAGQHQQILAVGALGNPQETIQTASRLLPDAENQVAEAVRIWESRIQTLQDRLPRLITQDKKLQRFYRRCLLTFLTTQWDLEGLALTPWIAESGIDGGAVCNYLWGDAYLSRFLSLAEPAAARALLIASMKADYSTHYAIGPLTGNGVGVGYSYNYYSMALLVYDYIAITGDRGILHEPIRGKPFLDALYEYVFRREDMTRPPDLIDYGTNENMLELRRTKTYQHYTPSPNLERLLIYRMMDRIFHWAGRPSPVDFKDRGRHLRKVILSQLWDQDLQWFRCLDQESKPQVCWSIQIFDMLRADVLSTQQAAGLVSHLNEKEFLSQWGVHSISKLDPGYDPTDIDWGGPGVYAGDGPELVADLLGAGFAEQGIDLLGRILWWGDLPYIPQAIRADSRDYRQDGRANVVAALAGAQAVVWGLFGIEVDGQNLTIDPVEHPYIAGMGVENLRIRGRCIRITVDPDGRKYSVDVDGKVSRRRIGRPYKLKLK